MWGTYLCVLSLCVTQLTPAERLVNHPVDENTQQTKRCWVDLGLHSHHLTEAKRPEAVQQHEDELWSDES